MSSHAATLGMRKAGALAALMPVTRFARLGGAAPSFRLPAWSLRLGRTPATVRYVFLGSPDFHRSHPPWRYVERMGAYHRLEAGGMRLTVVTRQRAGHLTEASFIVEPPAG
jgi:hypothetical protein